MDSVFVNLPTVDHLLVLIPGLGISLEEGNGNLFQYSCLGNPMDRGAWQATVYGVVNSWMWLSDYTFTLNWSSLYLWASLWLSWGKICLQYGRPRFDPWVGKIPWRRERLPTPVFWPGEFHGLFSPWGCKASDTTEWLSLHFSISMGFESANSTNLRSNLILRSTGAPGTNLLKIVREDCTD